MCFVLEEQEPILFLSLNVDLYFYSTSIDLFRFVKLIELSVDFKIFNCNGCKIHKADRLRSAKLFANGEIFFVSFLKKLVLKLHAVDNSSERGMTAVVGPISVDHSDLGYCGISLLADKILLTEDDIVNIHCKSVFFYKVLKSRSVKSDKSVERLYLCGNIIFYLERFGKLESRLSRFNGVDDVFFDLRNILLRKIAVKNVHLCGAHCRTVALRDDLDTLRRRICSLVKLTGQIFNGKGICSLCVDAVSNDIELRL